jgi:serine/threonine protein kinase
MSVSPFENTPRVLGTGTYAVVIRPPLEILDKIPLNLVHIDTVGKIMLCERKCVLEEWRVSRLLYQIDPKQRWFIYPIRLTKVFLEEVETATGEQYGYEKHEILNQFIMPYAGETLRKLNADMGVQCVLGHYVRVAKSIQVLLKKDIIHQDIHDKNLTVLDNKCHIIDFGMAVTTNTFYTDNNEMFQGHIYAINPPEYRLINEAFLNKFANPKEAISFEQSLLARYLNVPDTDLDFIFKAHSYYTSYATQHQYMVLCTRHKKFIHLKTMNCHTTVDSYALGVLLLKVLLKSKGIDFELKRKMETIIEHIMHPNPQARLSGKALVKSILSLTNTTSCFTYITYLSLLCK